MKLGIDKNARLTRFCRVAAVEFSRGFQPTVGVRASTASRQRRLNQASLTRRGTLDTSFPALKRRAKIRSPLRGCKISALRVYHHLKLNKVLFCLAVLGITFVSLSAQTQSPANQQFPVESWNKPFKPFRIIGNIYYVGTNNLACYLITTPGGYILIDTALEESAPIVRANIAALGFKLNYIRVILSSHAHFDHVAGHADMKKATGAQVYATAADATILESGGTKGFHPLTPYKPVKVDRIIKDGETVRYANVALTAHLTPGHTEGNTTWTTTVEEKGKKYNVVFVGSMSINPGVHLVNYPAWPNIAEVYAKSFQTLKSLQCDVFLGPHAPFFDMEAKVQRMGAEAKANPFIDPDGYRNYIATFEKSYNEQLQRERAGKVAN